MAAFFVEVLLEIGTVLLALQLAHYTVQVFRKPTRVALVLNCKVEYRVARIRQAALRQGGEVGMINSTMLSRDGRQGGDVSLLLD